MSDFHYAQPNFVLDADPAMDLLDASSLNTVLMMLEVIDSVEELALLETLTPAQKRQVWDATSEATRARLVQLKATAARQESVAAAPLPRAEATQITPLIDSSALSEWSDAADAAVDLETNLEALDLEAVEELDLTLQEPLPPTAQIDQTDIESMMQSAAQPAIQVGDWVVLQAKPQLSRAELKLIWQVVEVRGDSAQISADRLGTRNYPTAWMLLYPKPVEIEPEF